MHGPGKNTGGSYYYAPTWPALPNVWVWDGVVNTLKPRKKEKWRAARDYALSAWMACGLILVVHEELDPHYMSGTTDQDFIDAIVPGFLTLARMPYGLGGPTSTVPAAGGWWPEKDPGSIAGFNVNLSFWALLRWNQRYLLTHEIGHALGLKHSTQRTSPVYYGGWTSIKPDTHDVDSLRAYYEL